MVTFLMLAAFLALLRGAGILSVPVVSVTWVTGLAEFVGVEVPPVYHTGVLLLLPSRKSTQSQPSWIPIRAGVATDLLREHVL